MLEATALPNSPPPPPVPKTKFSFFVEKYEGKENLLKIFVSQACELDHYELVRLLVHHGYRLFSDPSERHERLKSQPMPNLLSWTIKKPDADSSERFFA